MFCLSGWIPPEKLQEESEKAEESALLREKQANKQNSKKLHPTELITP